jgi:hypothetical protein
MVLRRTLLAGIYLDTPNYINDAIAWHFTMRRREKKKVFHYQNSIHHQHNCNKFDTVHLPIAAAVRLHSITLYAPCLAIT